MGDALSPQRRGGSDQRQFTSIQASFLVSISAAWGALSQGERDKWVERWAWMCEEMDTTVEARKSAPVNAANRRTKVGLLIAAAVLVIEGVQAGITYAAVSAAKSSTPPQTITVKLPSGQTFDVTPAASPTSTSGAIEP